MGSAAKATGIGPLVSAARARLTATPTQPSTPGLPAVRANSQIAKASPQSAVTVTSVSPTRALSRIWIEARNPSPATSAASCRSLPARR